MVLPARVRPTDQETPASASEDSRVAMSVRKRMTIRSPSRRKGFSWRLFFLRWETRIDRLIRIRPDLQHRAMVIRVVSILVQSVRRHELDNLQGALGATDIRDVDVRLLFLIEAGDVLEQAIGKNGRQRWVLNGSRDGSRPVGRRLGLCFRIFRKF